MAKVCVEIEIGDDGSVTVGVCPPEEETGEPKDYMRPAQSVDDALGTAKDLLTNPQAQETGGQPMMGGQPTMGGQPAVGFNPATKSYG